jgi:hypothetical protein
MRVLIQLFFLAFLSVSLGWAQVAVDISAEPHHHLLLENDQVRVFALTLTTNEQAYVKQDHNRLTVALEDCEMVVWSEGHSAITSSDFKQGDTGFSYAGPPRGFRVDRTQECRDVIVEFLNPKITTYAYNPSTGQWDYAIQGTGNPVDPKAKFVSSFAIGAGKVAFAQLLTGDSFPAPDKDIAELLIPVTDVDFKTQGDMHIRKSSGAAIWIGTGRKSDLTNAGGTVRFVMVQLQTPAGK